MAKKRTTLTVDEEVLRAVKARAVRTGRDQSGVIEEVLRRALGFELLDRTGARNDLTETEAMDLALEAQWAVSALSQHLSSAGQEGRAGPPSRGPAGSRRVPGECV
ncbi:MAG: ribbon-helix-helix protein, CopG family [Trueperaceae bacterium]|nr:ribbon-helix-helix protein, CopG family [Trueperaceae bacterium]